MIQVTSLENLLKSRIIDWPEYCELLSMRQLHDVSITVDKPHRWVATDELVTLKGVEWENNISTTRIQTRLTALVNDELFNSITE